MPDEIVEIEEGDEGSDSLMNVVLLFAFLFVCYKAAEHFGWINKPKETGVPSGTPGTTSVTGAVAANAVTGAVTGSVTRSSIPTPQPIQASIHRTIYVVGNPELNGAYEAVADATPLKWKSETGAEIVRADATEPNKLQLWMGSDIKAFIFVSHDGADTTLKVVNLDGGVDLGVTATFMKPPPQPVADSQTPQPILASSGSGMPAATAASTSIAGAPTLRTAQSPPAPPPQNGVSVLVPVPRPPAPQTGNSVLVPVPNTPVTAPMQPANGSVLVPVPIQPAVPNPATMSVSSVHMMSDAQTSALVASLRGNARLILPAARATQQLHDYYDDSNGHGLASWTSGVLVYAETLHVDSSVLGLFECLGVIDTPAPNTMIVTYVLIYKNYRENEQYKAAWFEKDGFDKLCVRFPEVAGRTRSYVHVAGDRRVLEDFCRSKTSKTCERAGSVPASILHASTPRVTKNGGAYRLLDGAQSNPAPQPTTAATSITAAPTPRAPAMPVPVALEWPGAQTWNAMAEEPHRRVFFIKSTEETTRLKTAGLYSYAHDSAGVSTYVKYADVYDASSMQYDIMFKSSDQSVEIRRNAGAASGIYWAGFTFGTDGAIFSGSSVIGQAYVRPTKTTTSHAASNRLIGESTILLRHSATSAELQLLPVQVGTRTMSDVWSGRPAGSGASSALLYVTASGVPHVGGPPAPNGAMVCVYALLSNKLLYVAYLDETSGKFMSYVGADTQYSVSPPIAPTPRATVLSPVTTPPARAAPTLEDWKSAPAHKKCFLVTAKTTATTAAKKLSGWYGWRIVGLSTAYQKAAYTLGSDVYAAVWLEVATAGNQETVTITGTTSVTCTLQGTRGETSDVRVEGFLRQESQWASAKLSYIGKNNGLEFRDTLSRVSLSHTYGIADVWELDSYKGIYFAERGITHVGGPEMWPHGLIYTHNGASVTYLMYCMDAGPEKISWFRFSDKARVDLTVRAA